jgi:hypothetical protein
LQAFDVALRSLGERERGRSGAAGTMTASISASLVPMCSAVDLPVVTLEQAAAAARGGEVAIVASRWLGGAWMQDRLWERLGIGAAIRRTTAGRRGGRAGGVALVAQRALQPASKPAGTRWVVGRVVIDLQPRATTRTPTSSRARGTTTPNDTSA